MKQFNADNLSRLYSMLGGLGNDVFDPLESTFINVPPKYSRQQLSNAYRNIWACRKICDYLPNSMARGWGQLNLPTNIKLENEVNKQLTKLRNLYRDGQKMANLFGGAIIVRFIDDGRQFSEPIGDRFNSIKYSRIYDPWEVFPLVETGHDNLINPEFYQFSVGSNENITFKVHSDRILRFRGAFVDYHTLRLNRGFEDSLLVPFLDPCIRYLSAISYVGATVQSFEFIVHSLENLFAELENDEAQRHLAERLQTAYRSLGALRGLVTDKNEEQVQVFSRSYTGVKEVIELLLGEMIAASGLTKPQFIQEHPSGLSATGESERLAEADIIRALQIEKWSESIEYDVKLHLATKGYTNTNWSWEWSNLFQQTPSEEAKLHLDQANADKIRIESNVVTSAEIRAMRFEDIGEQM